MNPNIRSQKPVWQQVVDYVLSEPLGVGRSQVASEFQIAKGTAAYHLDKAVQRGELSRVYTWVHRNERGWVYYHPSNLVPGPDFEQTEMAVS